MAPGAYPLTAVTYGAIRPLSLDAQARAEYAAFIEYAAGPGQVPGLERGELPGGYAPLPANLQAKALAAANQVRTLVATPEPAPSTTTTTTAPAVAEAPVAQPQTTTRSVPRSNATVTATTSPSAPVPEVTPEPADSEPPTTTAAPVDEADEPKEAAPTVMTPFVELARSRYAVPGLGVMALGSALGVLEITKRPRRGLTGGPDGAILIEEDAG